ncbi:MAG TPA: hypothetical protein VN781_02135 [Acidimicrobiales bacterium]|nr:hypothetical protein [Acidimicrobiales bacterium]
MSSSELAGRKQDRGDWFRALAVLIVIPVVMVASVVVGGASPSHGAASDRQSDLSAPAISAAAPSTTTAPPVSTTTTTIAAAPPLAAPAPIATTAAPSASPAALPSVSTQPAGYGCAAALSYLSAHAAAGFTVECPGYADGNEAMTCVNHAPECAGEHLIVISDPCPAAYMNEAFNSNSWSDVTDSFTQGIDPYGSC